MAITIGDWVKALSGPMVNEIGKVVEVGLDGLLRVHHHGGAYQLHYTPDQVEPSSAPTANVPATEVSLASPSPSKVYLATLEPGLPHTRQARKETPVFSGLFVYFPDALAEVAKVSFIGNDQHQPGTPVHWDRNKSQDEMDAGARHDLDYAKGVIKDNAGQYTLAQAVWRRLARLQKDIEAEKAAAKEKK